ncbi:MAG: hypothetical protein V9G09_13445 [Candidatus Nanopelagicales bacterium]
MSDSRWHMPSVMIWRTFAPDRDSRFASLSVAQSPTRAAAPSPRSIAVRQEDFQQGRLAASRARHPVAHVDPVDREPAPQTVGQQVVLGQYAFTQLVQTVALVEGHVGDLKLLARNDVPAGLAAAGAAEVTDTRQFLVTAGGAVDDDRHVLDLEHRTLERGTRGGDVVCEVKGLRYDA